MNRSPFLLLCLLVLWSCAPPVLAQQVVPSDEIIPAHAASSNATLRVDPSAVRIVSPSAVTFDDVTWLGRRGGSGDSLAYFDTTGAEFAVQINSNAGDAPVFSILEESQRFTPGYGTSPPCGPDCPRGGVASSAGQISEFGFRLGGGGVQGSGSLLLIFSKFESGELTGGFIRPSTDVVLAVDLSLLTAGVFNVVDTSPFNLFFEADEEWIWGMQVEDDGNGPAAVRPVLDDGKANIGPLAEPGYYTPRRSGLRAYFPSGPLGAGFYYSTRTNDNNHWWFNRLFDGEQPDVDTEINAACGTTSDACEFAGDDTIEYMACGQSNASSAQQVTFRIFANTPGRIANFTLFEQAVRLPSGLGACRTFSNLLPPQAPAGRYEVRIDVRDNANNLLDYDHFFFIKAEPEEAASLNQPTPTDWLAQPTGEWTFIDREGEALSATARGETAAVIGAFPNPFARETTIRFEATAATEARLVIYDVMGREVAVLVDGAVEAGTHDVVFDARGLASGLYVYRLEAGAQTQTGRITLLK